jgi:hypothetical protein
MIKQIHYTYLVCSCLLLGAGISTRAQTVLTAGDIAVIAINIDEAIPNQRWAFMAMRSIAAGTIIHFTDKGYDNSINNFRAPATMPGLENDGYMTWQVQATIPAGTIIRATNNTINGSTAGVTGSLGSAANTLGFNGAGDQIIIYQGTSGTAVGATFIYAFNNGQHSSYGSPGNWLTTGSIAVDYLSYLPPGLINGTTALALTYNLGSGNPLTSSPLGVANYGFDNVYYGGITTGTKAQLLTAIGTPTNWAGDNFIPFNTSTGVGGVLPALPFVVLPVTLLHFNAEQATAGAVKLTWGTAMEVNNDHFTLERSSDALHYIVIGMVSGKGDNNQPVNYSFTDQSPEQGSNYYRLIQTDRDGQSKILGSRTVEVAEIALRVGPNPAVHAVDLTFNRGVWREIKLYNSAEQLLQTITPRVTTSRIKINIQNYRPGPYYLAFIGNNGQSTVKRFVKRE